MKNTITIHTDGSCLSNGKADAKGGWSAVLSSGQKQRQLSGHAQNTTNNRMELTAVVEGLRAIKRADAIIDLYTDSQYVQKGCAEWMPKWKANNWRTAKRKPVLNQELWQALDEQLQRLPNLSLHWVRGHNGDAMNELADKLAVTASHGRCVDQRLAL